MFLPTDPETVAACMREQDLLNELHAYQEFYAIAISFLLALEAGDKPEAKRIHGAMREQALLIQTGEAWEPTG